MDVYKPPEAELADFQQRPFKPIRGIFIGLLCSVVLTTVVSVVLVVIFSVVSAFRDPSNSADPLLSPMLLMTILVFNGVVLFFAGRVVAIRSPTMEIKLGIVLALATLIIYLGLDAWLASSQDLPVWYDMGAYLLIILIPLGAQTIATSKTE